MRLNDDLYVLALPVVPRGSHRLPQLELDPG